MKRGSKGKRLASDSLAYLDELTGIFNRRYLKVVEDQANHLKEKSIPFSLVIVDIDHFKEINDMHGHQKGDLVIKEFAHFFKDSLRSTDIVLRYGGDEFVCLMSNTLEEDARRIYDRILERCCHRKFADLDLMISAGVASYPGDGDDFTRLLQLADESLYNAKRSGRGQIGVIHKRRIELPTKAFIGRRKEVEVLQVLISEAKQVHIGLVQGSVGIGKTRLVKEVLGRFSGYEVLWTDCLAFFEDIPYYPIREIIKYKISRQGKRVMEGIPLAYRIEIGKLVPEAMDTLEDKVSEVGLVLDKYRLYESVRQVIEKGDTKKLVVFDNMQWVDKETVEIVKYLLRALRQKIIVFLFIIRQEEKNPVLDDFTSFMSREIDVKDVKLEPLQQNEIREMIKSIVNDEPGDDLTTYLSNASGGNPFYIEELIKGLNEGGYLTVQADAWRFDSSVTREMGSQIVPKSIEDITERKFQSLSKEGQEILEIASVIGYFDIGIIKTITSYNEGHIVGMLDNIKKLGLIKVRGERIEFHEELSRAAIYRQKVESIKGRVLHKQVGEQLELQYRGRESEIAEELAKHFYQSMDKEKGVAYCLLAGDRAKEKYAIQNAITYYNWAEELLKHTINLEDKKKRIDCTLKLSNVLAFSGENNAAIKGLSEALILVQEIKDQPREAGLRFNLAHAYFNTAQFQKSINEAKHAIDIYRSLKDEAGVIRGLNTTASSHKLLGDHEQALSDYQTALEMARRAKEKILISGILNNIAWIYNNRGEYRKALKALDDSMKISKEIHDIALEIISMGNLGFIYVNLAEYETARKYFEDSLRRSHEIGKKSSEGSMLGALAETCILTSEFRKALEFAEDALTIYEDIGDNLNKSMILGKIGEIYLKMGDYDGSLKSLEESAKISQEVKSREQTSTTMLLLGQLHLATGAVQKAEDFMKQASHVADSLSEPQLVKEISLGLCQVYLQNNELKKFETAFKRLKQSEKEPMLRRFAAEMDLVQGCYLIKTKNFREANTCLNRALKVFTEIGDKLNTGISNYHKAKLALAQGDKIIYRKCAASALKIFKGISARGWVEKAQELPKVKLSQP